jgi:glyoxylase-like metal-dependent hydrolase (beta-lactamase superfamily II)
MMTNMNIKSLPQSEHFTYHELAEGVWAAIVIPTGLAASNSGIVDLGDRTLIFDTTFSPASAMELRTVAETLTGRSVTSVLNSHSHNDHIFGNAVFDAATKIYATEQTRKIMAEKTEKEIADFKGHWPEQQKKWAEQAKNAQAEAVGL